MALIARITESSPPMFRMVCDSHLDIIFLTTRVKWEVVFKSRIAVVRGSRLLILETTLEATFEVTIRFSCCFENISIKWYCTKWVVYFKRLMYPSCLIMKMVFFTTNMAGLIKLALAFHSLLTTLAMRSKLLFCSIILASFLANKNNWLLRSRSKAWFFFFSGVSRCCCCCCCLLLHDAFLVVYYDHGNLSRTTYFRVKLKCNAGSWMSTSMLFFFKVSLLIKFHL